MAKVSSSANTDALNVWTYNGSSTGSNEALATIVAAGYFNSFMQNLVSGLGPLQIGDNIFIVGNDASGIYQVSDVTTNVEVVSFGSNGSVGTANIQNSAVTTAKIADANVTSAKLEAALLQHVQVALTLAEFIAGYTAPTELIAAPGAGKKIIIHRASLAINYGGTVLANGGAMSLQYDSTIHAGGTQATGTIAAATLIGATADTSFGFTPVDTTLLDSATVNKSITLATATGDFTGGTGSLYWIDVWYSVVAVN